MTENGVGYLPALAPLPHDLMLGDSNVSEKGFVEVGVTSHVHQGPDFNAGGIHAEKQERDTLVFRCFRLCAHQAENPVCKMRGAGPDLLAVHHPFVAIKFSLRCEAGEVTAGTRF